MSTLIELPLAETFAQKVAANVRAEVARKGLRQKDVARAVGLTQPRISNRWRGRTPWGLDELEAIAPMLGTTASELCAIRDSNPKPADLESDAVVINLAARRTGRAA